MTVCAKSKLQSQMVLVERTHPTVDDGGFLRVRGATRGSRLQRTWYQLTVLRPPMPQRGSSGRQRCSRPWNLNTNIMSCFLLNVTKSSNTSASPSFTFSIEIPFIGDFFCSFTLLCAAAVEAVVEDDFGSLSPDCDMTGATSACSFGFFFRMVRRMPRDGSLTVSFTLKSPRSAH